jgi:hypothetical protein
MKKFDENFENISFVKMESSTLINYSTNRCQRGQGIMVLYIDFSFMITNSDHQNSNLVFPLACKNLF